MKFVSEDERNFYWERGYLVIEKFLDTDYAVKVYQLLKKVVRCH
jgi:hypothetical protein